MKLEALLTAIETLSVRGPIDVEVSGVAVDSRRVEPGAVFVALSGREDDGHRFIGDALARGAVAVVSERESQDIAATWIQTPCARRAAGQLSARRQGNPAGRLELVGVTGTNGKTTTAYLLDGLFRRLAPPSAMMGTVVHQVAAAAEPARFTTPEAPEVQAFLARAVSSGCRYAVMEVSSHGLALERIEGCEFAAAVFTNLTRDHLDFHQGMEDYFAAKKRLFDRYLRPGRRAVVNVDDEFGRRLAESLAAAALTFGFSPDAQLRIAELQGGFDGLELRFREEGRERSLASPLAGRYNALNLLAAYGAARVLGFSPEAILEVLSQERGAPGRFERVEAGQSFHVIVDYAHTDDALRNVLETTRALPHRKLITVFGCGGDRDRTKRPLMGAMASRLSDLVVLTSDNPRREDPLGIIREIELGTRAPQSRAEIRVEPDRRKAIALALSLAQAGDVVLIAGKGHEPYQIIGDRVLSFDDRQVVRELLARGAGDPVAQAG